MRIACLGGGPAGLYFANSMKLRDPELDDWSDYDLVIAADGAGTAYPALNRRHALQRAKRLTFANQLFRAWPASCSASAMLRKLARLFIIKTRFEAFAVIYAIAVGAVGRGFHYLELYPGVPGYIFFAACTGAVFMAGAKILDAVGTKRKNDEERRVLADRRAAA